MLNGFAYIMLLLSVLLLIIYMVIRKDFERIGSLCGIMAIMLFIAAICILAFTGYAPHIIDDQYTPVSYP